MEKLKLDEFLRGSIVLIIMFGLYNILNYVFQISMARMLGPSDYGVLAVLMSIVYIFSIPSEAIQTIVTRYTSKFNIKKEYGKIKDLLFRSLGKGAVFSLIVFLIFLFISIFLSSWLNINFYLLGITGIVIFFSFLIPITRGVMQGTKKFKRMGLNMIMEAILKVIITIALVFFGLRTYGAIGGVVIALLLAFILSFSLIKNIVASTRKKVDFGKIYSYNLPSLVAITSIVLMYSLDILLARRFFSPELAGQYAFVSLIGKAIVFANLAVGKAMFPLTSEKFEKGSETKSLFKKSIGFVFLISGIALALYFLFPEFVIRILSLGSTKYLAASNVLFLLGLAFTFTSFSNIMILYNLSIGKMKKSAYFLLSFVVIEIVLLCIFNSNILEFSVSVMLTNLIMFVYSLFFTVKK
ncbi:MAG: oligosaccharide flippase family protein [Candidatus Nanoarchaeia archaeon]|nr:oligosaccharide flippase family protein [Candidatus Nanoarchaeia archaeon]